MRGWAELSGGVSTPRSAPACSAATSNAEVGSAAIRPEAAARGRPLPVSRGGGRRILPSPALRGPDLPRSSFAARRRRGLPAGASPRLSPKQGECAPQGRSRRGQPGSAGPGAASRRAEFSPCRQPGRTAGDTLSRDPHEAVPKGAP